MRTLPQPLDRMLAGPVYLPRVGTHDGRAIEQAMMGATLLDAGATLSGAVVEATYAAREPELLRRLRATHVPFIVDPQSLRFAGDGYLTVQQARDLEFAPSEPVCVSEFDGAAADNLARATLRFEQRVGAGAYFAPGLPIADADQDGWVVANRRVIEAACAANGTGELERRPLIVQIAPGRRATAQPEAILDWLPDLPIDAVYLQPLNLHPVKDSAEKLAVYLEFVRAMSSVGLPLIAGRVGAFGLVLQALGAVAFDSGLGDAESFALAPQLRPRKPRSTEQKSSGGRDRRVYIAGLKTTLQSKHAAPLLEDRALRARFLCNLGCCQYRGFEDLPARRRQHYLWTRNEEVGQLGALPESMRVGHVHDSLMAAREHGRVVRRVLREQGIEAPGFDHIDRWIGLLSREAQTAPV